MKRIIVLLVATSISCLISCTRASKSEVSSLKFDFSKVSQKGGGLVPLSAIPVGSEVCYGVNVIAADLPVNNKSCAPPLGIFAGFIPEAQELSLEVPFGTNREIQLYAYLPKAGSTCVKINEDGGQGLDPSSIYLVGKLSNILFEQPEVTLAMPISFPGVAHSIYADLNMAASCLQTGSNPNPNPINVDPNAPVIVKSALDVNTISTSGVDESLSLSILVKSVTPVNFLTLSHDGPNGNISGSGGAQGFYACTLANIATIGHICETGTVNDYYTSKSILVSQWAQNGTYSLNVSVTNVGTLTSLPVQLTYTITNHPVVSPPVLTAVSVYTDASLTSGGGGNIELKFLVQSQATPDWVEKALRRPDLSFVNGGGMGATFTNCSSYIASGGHVCYGMTNSHWFFSTNDSLSAYQPNGSYSYVNIRVRNAAGLYSAVYGSVPGFAVSGNITPTVPTILSIDGYYAFDNDPFSSGIPYYSSSCVRPDGANLSLGVRIKSNSTAPINWINYMLQGPINMIMGGGSGLMSVDLGGNNWQTDMSGIVPSVMVAPNGMYSWNGLSVRNAGDLTSTPMPGPSLNLQDSCSTTYLDVISYGGVTCGVTNNNKLKCWGQNTSNIIDHGAPTSRKFPTDVDGNESYYQVARGGTHTCATTLSNRMQCWGLNTNYQIGDGTTAQALHPKWIDTATSYSKVSAGQNHTCGITLSGQLKCWGKNNYGQIGDNTTIDKSTPVVIDSGVQYQYVDAGDNHTCAITSGGVLKCWGMNASGQVGDTTTTTRNLPTVINSGVTYIHINAGANSTCGITNANALKCWGMNTANQLGDSTTTNRTSPTVIDSGGSYTKVSMNTFHACGITISNSLRCWGQNTYGQIGDGTTVNKTIPTTVSGGSIYSKISVGMDHSCATTLSGQLKCWGRNTSYQLGNGTTSGTNLPIDIDL